MDKKYEKISQDLGVTLKQIDTVLSLTAEGATIPFIARYRKDMTGSLDEVAIKAIIDLDKSLTALNDRKEAVLAKIKEQGKLTKELEEAILAAEKLADVEELYLPYKEKRRTKATIAREAGLFPLARLILQNVSNLEKEAEAFVCEGFETPQEALAGAVDILVEALSEDVHLRSMTYQEVLRRSKITSQVKDESLDEKQVFQIYYDFSETVANMQGYRTLALNRGEKLGILKIGFEHATDRILSFFSGRFKVKNAYIDEVIQQSVKKKVLPAIERRIRTELTEKAEEGAIQLFSENLRNEGPCTDGGGIRLGHCNHIPNGIRGNSRSDGAVSCQRGRRSDHRIDPVIRIFHGSQLSFQEDGLSFCNCVFQERSGICDVGLYLFAISGKFLHQIVCLHLRLVIQMLQENIFLHQNTIQSLSQATLIKEICHLKADLRIFIGVERRNSGFGRTERFSCQSFLLVLIKQDMVRHDKLATVRNQKFRPGHSL